MIREFAHGDRDCVLALLVATGNFNAAEIAVAKELMDTISTCPGQTDYYGFVHAGTPGELAGLLIIGPAPATTGTWHMYWIAVHPRCYGAGVAQELDSFAEAFVRERGARNVALQAWRGLGCRDGRRVDLRCGTGGRPQFLEVNPLPGLHPEISDLAMLCRMAGVGYVELIETIIHPAKQRMAAATGASGI